MYTCILTRTGNRKDTAHLAKLLAAEPPQESPRASSSVTHTARELRMNIQAKDAVALRATANSMMKQIAIYEKMADVHDGKRRRTKN